MKYKLGERLICIKSVYRIDYRGITYNTSWDVPVELLCSKGKICMIKYLDPDLLLPYVLNCGDESHYFSEDMLDRHFMKDRTEKLRRILNG